MFQHIKNFAGSLISFLGGAYFLSAVIMGNLYSCSDEEGRSGEYNMFKGMVWPYHVFVNLQWKKDRPLRTSQLGIMIIYAGMDETTLDIREALPKIKTWVDDLPEKERGELKKASLAFGNFVAEHKQQVYEKVVQLDGYSVKIEGRLSELKSRYSDYPEFNRAWISTLQKFGGEMALEYNEVAERMRKQFPTPPELDQESGLPKQLDGHSTEAILQSPEYQEFKKQALRVIAVKKEVDRISINSLVDELFD
jgi:hypothetical protein